MENTEPLDELRQNVLFLLKKTEELNSILKTRVLPAVTSTKKDDEIAAQEVKTHWNVINAAVSKIAESRNE